MQVITWKGAWSSAATYNPNDEVTLSGTTYLCTATNTNQTPPNTTYWSVVKSPLVFPSLQGLGWGIKKTSEYFGVGKKAVAPGYDTEVSYGPDPIFHFECTYNVLNDVLGDRLTLENFYSATQGQYTSFLLYLPNITQNTASGIDGTVTGQTLTVDASNYAPLQVTRTYVNENIFEPAGVFGNPGTAPQIYDGVTLLTAGTDYNIISQAGVAPYTGAVVQFLSTPSGAVTANFSWYYRCRFEEDTQDMNLFMYELYEAKSIRMVVTRTK